MLAALEPRTFSVALRFLYLFLVLCSVQRCFSLFWLMCSLQRRCGEHGLIRLSANSYREEGGLGDEEHKLQGEMVRLPVSESVWLTLRRTQLSELVTSGAIPARVDRRVLIFRIGLDECLRSNGYVDIA